MKGDLDENGCVVYRGIKKQRSYSIAFLSLSYLLLSPSLSLSRSLSLSLPTSRLALKKRQCPILLFCSKAYPVIQILVV